MNDGRRVVVALFGAGRAGHIHFKNLIACHRVHLKYIVDVDTKAAEKYVSEYNQTEFITVVHADQCSTVYGDSSVAAVFVCSPTYTHEEIVMNSLKSGKAVFCEKPISQDIEGTKRCYRAAEECNKPLFCSFNRRYDPAVREIHDRMKDIGVIYNVKTTSRDHPFPPLEYLKVSGGIFHDCGVHDVDMVCWILKQYPESVFAHGYSHNQEVKDMHDYDTVLINLKFPKGVLVSIDMSRNAGYGYDQRIEVFGSKGMLVSELQRPINVSFSGDHHSGKQSSGYMYSFPERYAQSYVNALDHFLNVLQGKEELGIPSIDTIRCSEIITACEESCEKGIAITLNLGQYRS